jgi:hypothetical protein
MREESYRIRVMGIRRRRYSCRELLEEAKLEKREKREV